MLETIEKERLCFYRSAGFRVSQGYSGKTYFKLDIEGELSLTTDDIFSVFKAIDAWLGQRKIDY